MFCSSHVLASSALPSQREASLDVNPPHCEPHNHTHPPTTSCPPAHHNLDFTTHHATHTPPKNTMSNSELFFSLLRISAAQILRSAGLTTAKPSVVDAFTDILARHLHLLGSTTREIAESSGRLQADIDDVRLALEHVGVIRPVNIYNDPEDADTRGVDALVEWFRGTQAAEMRRVAGYAGKGEGVGTEAKNEEWIAGAFGLPRDGWGVRDADWEWNSDKEDYREESGELIIRASPLRQPQTTNHNYFDFVALRGVWDLGIFWGETALFVSAFYFTSISRKRNKLLNSTFPIQFQKPLPASTATDPTHT